ncbi:hypothetical protein ACJJTC_018459 [Scirpophaga incertulas]
MKNTVIEKFNGEQEAEWKQFQSDLLMTVRVANDFKTEAQRELERLVSENKIARDRIRLLEDQVHSLKGVNKSESVDSVTDLSADEKTVSKESLYSDSQSDTSSKDVFKNIRSRYISRVHSVTDSASKDTSIVEQAFYRLSLPDDKTSINDLLEHDDKVEIDNVTTDETNDDDAVFNDTGQPNRILAEVVLPPFDVKGIKRQDALDCSRNLIKRQEALDKHESLETTAKTEQFKLKNTDEDNISIEKSSSIFSTTGRNKSNNKSLYVFNRKQKSLSMEDISSACSCSNKLKEASSVENLGNNSSYNAPLNVKSLNSSESSYLKTVTPSEDFPLADTNIDSQPDPNLTINNKIPVVKAASILPSIYPDDKIITKQEESMKTHKEEIKFPVISIENDFKNVNGELTTSIEAALKRIDVTNDPSAKQSIKPIENQTIQSVDFNKDCCESMGKSIEKEVLTKVDISPSIRDNNPFLNTDSKSVQPALLDDDVSYHLKINSLDDLPSSEKALVPLSKDQIDLTSTDQALVPLSHVPRNRNVSRLKAYNLLSPIKIVNGSISSTSPIILSPVLIQPIFFKSQAQEIVHPKPDVKKSTVYYDDIDQVIVEDKQPQEKHVTEDFANINKTSLKVEKNRIYQKNTKAKQLPFLSWKTFNAGDSSPENKSPSPIRFSARQAESPKAGVVKLNKTPEWLIDNQYYQPMDNVPFFINTTQSVTNPISNNKSKDNARPCNTNPFLHGIPTIRRESEQENVYEEIGEPVVSATMSERNVADDDKLSKKILSATDEFESITREAILNVPRRPKKPRKESQHSRVTSENNNSVVKEMANITKSVISLSRTPSAKEKTQRKSTGSICEIVNNLEKKPNAESLKVPDVPSRKYSLQNSKAPNVDTNTGSWPREPKPYWKLQEHKRLSYPIRSLNDPLPSRPLPACALVAMPPRAEEPPPPPPLLTSASLQDLMASAASHRRTKGVSRQDSRLSVKSLIESIENAAKAAKQSPATTPVGEWPQQTTVPAAPTSTIKNGLSDSTNVSSNGIGGTNYAAKPPPARAARPSPIATDAAAAPANIPDEQRALASLQQKAIESFVRRNSYGDICERKDPLKRTASEERRLEAQRAAQVVPAEDHGIQQHRHYQFQLVLERRHGAVRAAALVPGRHAGAVRCM